MVDDEPMTEAEITARHSESPANGSPTDGVAPGAPPAATAVAEDNALPEDRYLNRELSWLDFNARVLALAADTSLPLLERAKFLAIFASNLDEFYMVRVAGLKRRDEMGLTVRSARTRIPAMPTYRLHYFPESGNSYKLALMPKELRIVVYLRAKQH
jgi:polyphosphate kinase